MSRWQSPGYLLGVAGQRTVPVEVGAHYLEEGWGQQLMPLADFLARHVIAPPDTAPGCPAAKGARESVCTCVFLEPKCTSNDEMEEDFKLIKDQHQ